MAELKAWSVREVLRWGDEFNATHHAKNPVKNMWSILHQVFVPEYFERYKKGVDNFANPNIYERFFVEFGKLDSKGWYRTQPKEATHMGFFFGNQSPLYMLEHFTTTQGKYDGLLLEPNKIFHQDWQSDWLSHGRLYKRMFLVYKMDRFEIVWNDESKWS